MSDGFWTAFFGALTVLLPFAWNQYRLVQKEREERRQQAIEMRKTLTDALAQATQAIKADVARNVKLNREEVDLLKTGAFRKGHEEGQKYAVSNLGELRRHDGSQ